MHYVFGHYVLDTARRELLHAGTSIRLEPKAYQILAYLVEHRDRLVTREELLEQVWPDVYVDDSAVARSIGAVRRAVGDSRERQTVILTRRAQGYRFVAEVVIKDDTQLNQAVLEVAEPAPPVSQEAVPASHSPTENPAKAAPKTAEESQSTASRVLAGERKPVTVLCGVFEIITPLDLDNLDDLLGALISLVQGAVSSYSGHLHHASSDRIEVFFGLPETQEDHAQRAVLAALALQQHWEDRSAAFACLPEINMTLYIGLHTGLVAAKPSGRAPDLPFMVVGDVAMQAAEVARQAEASQIVVSEAVAQLVRRVVDLEPLVPGRRMSQSVYHIVGRSPGADADISRSQAPEARFVGREGELALLQTCLGRVIAGQGQVVGIMGEPGMGKSRLLRAFHPQLLAAGAKVVLGHCQSYGAVTPYLALGAAVRQWFGITVGDDALAQVAKVQHGSQALGMDAAAWAPCLLALLGVAGEPEAEEGLSPEQAKARLFSALHQMAVLASQRQPLVVVIEDLHWVDPSTEAFVQSLVEQLDRLPLLLLVTYRPGYQPPWGTSSIVTQIGLAPLSSPESFQVMQAILQRRDADDPLYQRIEAKAQGNPFFLEELARGIVEQEGDEGVILRVPDTVQTVLAARIDRLPPDAKYLLQTAAVFGPEVPLAPLQAVTAWSDVALEAGLAQLRAAEFLYESHLCLEPTYRFRHALTQEVAYASLLRRARRELHLRIAQVLAECFPNLAETQPERLAHHYSEAEHGALALPYWLHAARRAIRRAAHVEAQQYLTYAQDLVLTLPESDERREHKLTLQLLLSTTKTRRGRAIDLL